MHVSGDLGFSNLVLVVCLVFPVVFLVIRRKWRLAVSRKEEVKRLLVLASEEAAKAELEASITYGVVSVSPGYHCAVCYSPTTTRCARCKAVRYCSGKCQIIHWRQGHKDNCHPPTGTFRANDEVIDSARKVAVQDRCKIYGQRLKIENRLLTEQIEVYPVESELSVSSSSSKVPCGNIDDVKEFHADEEVVNSATESSGNSCAGFFASPTSSVSSDDVSVCESDDIKVEFQADNEGENSPSESSGTLFSGFSSSPSRSESSDDSSVSESISSNEHEMAKGPLTADIAGGLPETTISLKDMGLDKPLLPKFTSLVESVDNFSKLNKINQIKSSSGNAENQCVSSSCTDLDAAGKYEGSAADNSIPCSDFWSRTLESIESINDTCNGSAPSKYGGTSKSDLTDSGSFLHFSFSLPGSTSPLYSHVSEVRNTASTALGSNEVANGIASLVASHVKNSVSRESSTMVKDRTETALHDAQSKEVKPSPSLSRADLPSTVTGVSTSTDASHISSLSSSGSEKLNGIVNDPGSSSPPLKSRDVRHSSSSNFKADLTSSAVEDSARSAKHGSAKGIETTRTVVSQVTSSPNGKNGLKTSVWKVVDQFRGSKLLKNHPLAGGSENAGRYSDKGLFMYELFVKLYTSNKIELQPCGLLNCGNSCYANAVLQCLTFTPPLTAYFLQGLHSKTCVNKKWCFTCEFENMILKAKEAKAPLSPSGILSQLQNSGSQLGNGREEDAHEFLRYAIDAMQSVCLMEAGANASGSLEKEETTLVGLTFGGYLQSKIQCMKCQGKSERHERMMDLTVEIEGDIGTLEEALRRFTGTEILDGENKYRCGRCKSYERAKKKLKILEAPNVLTIALKRFQSGKFGKLNKSIQFPEILNLAPYMSGTSDKSPIYRLYGVVVHLDVMNAAFSGHYVCYVKNFQNKWFKIDDSVVTTTELEKVLTKGAYMLLYARYSPRAPRLVRNKIVSSDPKNKVPSGENGKISWSKLASTRSGIVQHDPNSVSAEGPASIESFYSKFHRLQRILEEDSSSDSSSLISSHSDEGSCSTDSTRDSASIDDFSDYVFGDLGRGWSSTWRNSSDSDTSSSSSSSSSPLYSRHSPLAVSDRYARTSGCRPDDYVSDPARDGNLDRSCNGNSRPVDLEGKGSDPFLYSDMTKQCRKLGNSSSCRATDSEKVGWFNQLKDVKVGASLRKSTRERTE